MTVLLLTNISSQLVTFQYEYNNHYRRVNIRVIIKLPCTKKATRPRDLLYSTLKETNAISLLRSQINILKANVYPLQRRRNLSSSESQFRVNCKWS